MHIKLRRPRFKNTTALPSGFLREVVRFCTPHGCGPIRIWFKRAHCGFHFTGRCYSTYVTCKVPQPVLLRRIYHSGDTKGYIDWRACTYEEALVALVAHELRHVWQFRNARGRRVWGSRGLMSERDADAFAIRKMREWRRKKPARMVALPQEAPVAAS